MKQIDVRFTASDMAVLRSMIGKKMLKYKCDPFEYTTAVYGIVGVAIEDSSFAFTNRIEVMDYFGEKEDVALFKMKAVPYEDVQTLLQEQSMVENPVDSTISKVLVVNETQRLFENNIQIYEVNVTRGVIFVFEDGLELSFEKNIWFSEDISIEKGYDLIDRFTPVTEFEEGWSGAYRGECSREIISA